MGYSKNMNKIILGTAQFGMNYGINNSRGQIPLDEIFKIINTAYDSEIDILDTAYIYGESENNIGKYIEKYNKKVKLISKLPECDVSDVKSIFLSSLNKLKVSSFYCYLLHDYQNSKEIDNKWSVLEKLKSDNKVEKIGMSIYYPSELEEILSKNMELDIIQLPFNIFDNRFSKYFNVLKDKNIEIHARSVFLQGIVFKSIDKIENGLKVLKERIKMLNLLSADSGVSIVELCLNYVIQKKYIDNVIVGVDSLLNLKQIIEARHNLSKIDSLIDKLSSFAIHDEKVIVPSNWKLKSAQII